MWYDGFMGKLLSVVIPAYNEENAVITAADTITDILSGEDIAHELIFVDDGSADRTWERVMLLSKERSSVVGVRFSRNFGKEAAICAGLSEARGDCVAVLDCDLQHPPETLVKMYRLWEEGYQVIEGIKADRGKESVSYSFFARMFYSMISRSVGIDMERASDFKLLDRGVVDVINDMPERNMFFRALSFWVGYRSTRVEYDVQGRVSGTSKWSSRDLFRYALRNIASFSTAPMQIVTVLGVIMFVISILLGVTAIVQKLMGIALGGFTTVILIQLFSGSIIMISLGVIGYYIAMMYDEIKDRPRFLIASRCGREEEA